MTYDQWKTTDPREMMPYDEEQPTELDLVYEQLHQAQATISRLTAERDEANAAIARVWKALGVSTYEEAGGREISEIVGGQRDGLRKALESPSDEMIAAMVSAMWPDDAIYSDVFPDIETQMRAGLAALAALTSTKSNESGMGTTNDN